MNIKRKSTGLQPLFFVILLLLTVQFIGFGCGKGTEPGNNIQGSLIATSGCIDFLKVTSEPFVPPCCTGFSYEYDSETEKLSITHFGAGFNCCADPSAEFIFDDTLILIDENESGDFCTCLCLFNIDYEFENVAPGVYTIRFIEIYATDEDIPLELTFDLTTNPTGSVQVERSQYPWDDSSNPVGKLIDISGCGGFQVDKVMADSTGCLFYSYDGDSILTLEHTRAIFNCCPDTLWAEIATEYNIITIDEKESTEISGGCYCICNYDFRYKISDLKPGFYTIKINEPYLTANYEELTLSVGLYSDTSGTLCLDRPLFGTP